MRLLESKELIGRVVIDAAGQALGMVSGLVLDAEEWKVQGIQLKLRKEVADGLGIRRGRFRAPTIVIPAHLVLGATDTVVLKVNADGLREVPSPAMETPAPPTA